MAKAQAKAGGEYGVNGEHYEGGQFLPSSPSTVKGMTPKIKAGGRVETAPYVWEKTPENNVLSIYDRVAFFVTDNRKQCQFVKGQGFIGLMLEANRKAFSVSCTGPCAVNVEFFDFISGLVAKFNAGERWYNLADDKFHHLNS